MKDYIIKTIVCNKKSLGFLWGVVGGEPSINEFYKIGLFQRGILFFLGNALFFPNKQVNTDLM